MFPSPSLGVPGPFAGEFFISIFSPLIMPPDPDAPLLLGGPPGVPEPPGGGPPGPIEPILPSEVLHMSPDIVEAGFIIVYMLSPKDGGERRIILVSRLNLVHFKVIFIDHIILIKL